MTVRATITALVPTFNEAHNIEDCLRCLSWVDQLIVVDSFSTDATVELASHFTDEVFQHEYINSATQKNWALSTLPIRGDWTLIVDADERIVPELADEIQDVLATGNPGHLGYFINRRNYFFGHWIRHAGMYPSWNLRLFRTGKARYEDKEVDADVKLLEPGDVGYLKHDMLHYSFLTVGSCIQKWNRYSTWDALERMKPRGARDDGAIPTGLSGAVKTGVRRLYERLPGKPLLLFLYLYLVQRGFLDGRAGYVTCSLLAFREFQAGAKQWELRSNPAAYGGDRR